MDISGENAARRGSKSPEAFRTISEVAAELEMPQHVLRFWETKFPQVKPLKRGGGRRYYRPEDIELLRKIRRLLYMEGYTIKGVQKILREHSPRSALQAPSLQASGARPEPRALPRMPRMASAQTPASTSAAGERGPAERQTLELLLEELLAIKTLLGELGK